jgi:hypothetical protein
VEVDFSGTPLLLNPNTQSPTKPNILPIAIFELKAIVMLVVFPTAADASQIEASPVSESYDEPQVSVHGALAVIKDFKAVRRVNIL